MVADDLYRTLGIPAYATLEQIKAAYRRKALRLHPDRNPDGSTEAQFKRCSEAYAILIDPDRRVAALWQGLSVGSVGDLARQMLRDVKGRLRWPTDGQDIDREVQVSLSEVLTGSRVELAIVKTRLCATCRGDGAHGAGSTMPCPLCNGRGDRRWAKAPLVRLPCGRCGGRGVAIRQPCDTCEGVGTVEEQHLHAVSVPKGVRNGFRIAVKGAGEPGMHGGAAGNLNVRLVYAPQETFEVHGSDAHLKLPASLTTCALGGTVYVPTLTGRVALKIPAGTQSGDRLRLRGCGLPTEVGGATCGDQIVHVLVETPVALDEMLRARLQQLDADLAERMMPRQQAFRQQLASLSQATQGND